MPITTAITTAACARESAVEQDALRTLVELHTRMTAVVQDGRVTRVELEPRYTVVRGERSGTGRKS